MVAMTRQKVSQQLVSDQLWELLEPSIPPPPPAKNGRTSRPRGDDRAALEGILFVTANGNAKEETAHRVGLRFRSHLLASTAGLAGGRSAGEARPRRARPARPGQFARLVESVSGLGQRPGGERTGPNPTDRGILGTKYHLLVDPDGLPLAVAIAGANRHDSMLVEPILDGPARAKGRARGRPRRRPVKLHADKAYDNRRVRHYLRRRGITPRIARIGVNCSERLGRYHWVVERTTFYLLAFRRLAIRYDRSATTVTAVATLAITIICARRLPRKD